MTSRRVAKASQAVLETVSMAILRYLRDPRVKNVTVLAAEVGPDMRTAKVYVSVMGTAKEQSLCMHGLESATGFLQSKLADRLQTRYTPVLTFVLDQGVKRSAETNRLLREAGLTPDDEEEEDGEESVSTVENHVGDQSADDERDDEFEEGFDNEDEEPGDARDDDGGETSAGSRDREL